MKAAGFLDKSVLAQIRSVFMWSGVFSFFSNILMLTMPIFMMNLFSRVIPSGSMPTLWALLVIAAGCLALQSLLEALRTSMLSRLASWVESRLSADLFVASVYETVESGRGQGTEPLRDLNRLRTYLQSSAFTAFMDAPWVPLFLLVLFLLHWAIGVVALIGALVLLGLAVVNEAVTRQAVRTAGDQTLKMFRKAQDNVRNAEVIAAMGMLPALARRWDEESRSSRSIMVRAGDRNQMLTGITKYVRMLLQISVMSTGVVLVLRHELNAGVMIAASIIVGRAMMPIEMAISGSQQFVQAREAYRRIKTAMTRAPKLQKSLRLPRPSGKVAVERLVYTHPVSRQTIIKGITFAIEPGEAIGVVGPTAAGKSTLARLVVGVLRPSGGSVRLDGADIFSWASDDVGAYIGYLPQDVELFEGSIKENIARMGTVEDEKVLAAAKLAGIHEMILTLPEGYETEIGAGGMGLSGGQRQRVGLARAFYGMPALVVLDEPNANLDADGETALQAAVKEAKELGITTVLIAHRPSIMSVVDKLLVLQAGQVAMYGPADEIAKRLKSGNRQPPLRVAASQAESRPAIGVSGVGKAAMGGPPPAAPERGPGDGE